MKIDTAKLRELAEAATPGPWESDCDMFDRDEGIVACVINESVDLLVKIETGIYFPHKENYSAEDYAIRDHAWLEAEASQERKDAAFIAAANPQTVIALLDDNDQLRAACAKWQDHFTNTPGLAAANAEIVSLRAQLAAMTAARDEACDLAVDACDLKWDSDKKKTRDRIADLRKVGQ